MKNQNMDYIKHCLRCERKRERERERILRFSGSGCFGWAVQESGHMVFILLMFRVKRQEALEELDS